MENIEQLKQEYAKLVVNGGINIQKGQRLVINCPVEGADFARLCAKAAYDAGCREVLMRWSDDKITRLKYLHADNDVFDRVDPWEKLFSDSLADEKAAWLAIYAEDPENLKGVDPDRIRRAQISRGEATKKFRDGETRNEFQWCVCSIPTLSWAGLVFPDLSDEEAMEKLWEEILKACRADCEGACENWKKHSDEIQHHVDILNEYDFKSLHYTNSLGTDLYVELPEGHFWAGGEEKSTGGVPFSANIPTEEVFTLPKKDGVNGMVYSSRPLCHNGNIIRDFHFVIKDGKIAEVHAAEREDILKDAIAVDEGASYFGEVALVPYDSPISNSGVLFLNTLFDENASCHMAFGEAYPCIKGSENMSEEELKEKGVNSSITHVDFMIGTEDLKIIGTTKDGREVPVFENGNFTF